MPIAAAVILLYLFLTDAGAEQTEVVWLALGAALISMAATPLVFGLQGLERMQYTAYSEVLSKAAVAFGGAVAFSCSSGESS